MENDNQFCAPSKGKDKYTCYTFNALLKIAKKWNHKNQDNPIDPSLFKETRKRALYKALKETLGQEAPCTKDYCWNKHPIVGELNDPEIIF